MTWSEHLLDVFVVVRSFVAIFDIDGDRSPEATTILNTAQAYEAISLLPGRG
jgi:hypothetical protein